ncbi:tRNA (guanine-N(7)-)-methyltransferase [Spiroplasma gladiatoris]|uniref:tRNA (guanine-N(7)-)-methyltransferase n=1 Tax=Spiroplasma gladiatoris TaxID=2143 RepID=A0A4P7AGU2_9MOLU|nr:tRNA (guanosine(46)-N7)-methyltransferase TrmB [Spiroplasma gladiatoris]QBQ07311.1 tRNA (guanine-N(7)-)-methyltransferase [Spiroplasma gladiatoris]
MRLRNKNWTKDFIKENEKHLLNKEEKVNLFKCFKNENNCFLEIGCGKGQFIIDNATKNLNNNYIAMEKESTVIGVALKKALERNKELHNLKFLNTYAEKLKDLFNKKTFEKIFLNFSDPWPKSKHYKKRLTYKSFLNIYYELLKDNGRLEIKTDNDKLYLFTLEQIDLNMWKIIYNTTDLYKDLKELETNIPTEYEQKFHSLGKNINKIILKKIS